MDDNSGRGGGGRGASSKHSGSDGHRGGRSGRGGQFRMPPKELKGQIEGLPLLLHNKSTNLGDELQKWISAMKTYTMANFIMDLDNIFNNENPAYPIYVEPATPVAEDRKRGDTDEAVSEAVEQVREEKGKKSRGEAKQKN